MLKSFAEYFSLNDMQAIRSACFAYRQAEDADGQKTAAFSVYRDSIDQHLAPAFYTFWSDKQKSGQMHPASNSSGYDFRFVKAWDAIAKNSDAFRAEPEKYWESVQYHGMKLTFSLSREFIPYSKHNEKSDETIYAEFIALMDKGDIEWFMTGIDGTCSKTDLPLALQFNNWVPELWYFDVKKGAHFKAEPRDDMKKVLHETVTFPTGHLLIADWFRIDEFTKLTREYDGPSINSEAGIEAKVRDCAKRLNFASVFVGNTCPSVFTNDSQIVIGHEDEDTPSVAFKTPGHVTTDLWWATIIDKQTLIDLLKPAHGVNAVAVVDEYISENGVDEIHVTPGKYNLYFDSDQETFDREFAAEGVDLKGIEEAYCMLSRTELILKNKVSH